MKKVIGLLLVTILCLAFPGTAVATPTSDGYLIEWGSPTSSDPSGSGHVDSMDPGNPNFAELKDIASLDCYLKGRDLMCVIENGYPGYQEYVTTTIRNISDASVRITRLEVISGISQYMVDVDLTDTSGNIIPIPTTLNTGQELDVRVVTRVNQQAAQLGTYAYQVKVEADQEEPYNPPYYPPYYPPYNPPYNPPYYPPEYPPYYPSDNPESPPPPPAPEETVVVPQERVNIPLTPVELPYTGGNIALFSGTAFTLGGIGLYLRRRK
ncbi:MAG: LPXTG cell wall anchor domain-containing protein [Syntrophomonas sp.]